MFKNFIIFLFAFVLLVPQVAKADIWPEAAKAFKKKNKHSSVECPTFDKKPKTESVKKYYKRTKKQRKSKIKSCAPQLTKQLKKLNADKAKDLKELKKLKSEGNKLSSKIFIINKCIKAKGCNKCANYKRKVFRDTTGRMSKTKKCTDYKKVKWNSTKRKQKAKEVLGLQKKLNSIQIKTDSFSRTTQNYKDKRRDLSKLKKDLCSPPKNQRNICPAVKTIFAENPTIENFENMIKMVGPITYNEDGETHTTFVRFDEMDIVKDIKKSNRGKFNQKQYDYIQSNKNKAEQAWKNYEKNQKKDDLEKPLPVKSLCGSCNEIKRLFKKAMTEKDSTKVYELHKLDMVTKCNMITKPVNSCSDTVHDLVSKKFKNLTVDLEEGEKLSIEKAFSDVKNKTYNLGEDDNTKGVVQNRFSALFNEINKTFTFENGRPKACGSCSILKEELNKLGSLDSLNQFSLKDAENKSDIEYFTYLKDLGLKNLCIEEGTYTRNDAPVCEKKAAYLKDFVKSHDSLSDITYAEKERIDSEIINLKAYEEDNKMNCCDEVIGDLKDISAQEINVEDKNYIDSDNTKVKLAELMSCMTCGLDKNKDIQPISDRRRNPKVSCDFYKSSIQGKTGHIEGLLKPKSPNGKQSKYSVEEFKDNEIYTCKDGPKKSLINQARDWETIAYSPNGKYGDLAELDLKCFIDPKTGEAVNLTCCQVSEDDPYFKQLHSKLLSSELKSSDFKSVKFKDSDAIKKMNAQTTSKKAQTFCNKVFAKYAETKIETTTNGWKICKDNKNQVFWKVQNPQILDIDHKAFGEVNVDASTVVLE
jgi:hypothetical protein